MQSRFVLSANHEPRGAALRVVVATFFFLSGAIASNALYPHVETDGGVSRNAPAPAKADSHELNAFSPRDSTEYTGGPIPEPTFTTQAVADVATKESLALPTTTIRRLLPTPKNPITRRTNSCANKSTAMGATQPQTDDIANNLRTRLQQDTGILRTGAGSSDHS